MQPASNYKPVSYEKFKENLTREIEDCFSTEQLNAAFTLPCGHNINESTIAMLKNISESTIEKARKLCPQCSVPFKTPYKNLTIRNVVEIAKTMPDAIEIKDHTEEAEKLFGNSKSLCREGKIKEAITMVSKALDLSPNYQQAIGYNACLLDMLPSALPSSKVVESVPSTKEKLIRMFQDRVDDIHAHSSYQKETLLLKQTIDYLKKYIEIEATNTMELYCKKFENGEYHLYDNDKREDYLYGLLYSM